MKRVFINGFGRIGRCICKILFEEYNTIEIVQINDPNISIDNAVYLLKHDSIYGAFAADIYKECDYIVIENSVRKMQILYTESVDICNLRCAEFLIESSDQKYELENLNSLNFKKIFLTKWLSDAHRIILDGLTINNNVTLPKIISCGICDTAAIVPFLLQFNSLEVESVNITTMHPFLGYQNVLDGPPRDVKHTNNPHYQLGRSSFNSVIPKKSSVQGILEEVFPHYKGKLSFMTYRIPTDSVTVCDINVLFYPKVSKRRIEQIIEHLSKLAINEESPLISRDFAFSKKSFEYDKHWTILTGRNLHCTLWYNNELGYSATVCRLVFKELMASL